MKFLRRDEKGFTLIEALIVVIIVAILAVLGIARFLGVREATAEATCQSHLSTINAAIKKYELDTGLAYTNDPAEWDIVYLDAGSPICPNADALADDGGYIAAALGVEFEAVCTTGGLHDRLSTLPWEPAAP